MTSGHSTATANCQRRRRVIDFYSAGLMALSVGFTVLIDQPFTPIRDVGWPIVLLTVAAYFLAERFYLDVDRGPETAALSLADIPNALSLIFLGPLPTVAVRLGGSLIAMLSDPENKPQRVRLNLLIYSTESLFAHWLFRLIGGEDTSFRLLLAALVTLIVASIVTLSMTTGLIAVINRSSRRLWVSELSSGLLVTPIIAATGALSLAPALVNPWLAPLSILPVGGMWFLLRQQDALATHYKELSQINAVPGRLASSTETDIVLTIAADEVATVCETHSVAIACVTAAGEIVDRIPPRGQFANQRWYLDQSLTNITQPFGMARTQYGWSPTVEPTSHIVAPFRGGDGQQCWLLAGPRHARLGIHRPSQVNSLATIAQYLEASLERVYELQATHDIAIHDPVTGELNRRGLEQHLAHLIGEGGNPTLLSIHLPRFRDVHDSLGHRVSDQALANIANRIQQLLDAQDRLARLSDAVFVVFTHYTDTEAIMDLASAITLLSLHPIEIDGFDVVLTANLGIVTSEGLIAPTELIRRAEVAAMSAVQAQVPTVIYDESIDRRGAGRLAMVSELRSALMNNELAVVYQPQVDLARNRVIGAEALIRWYRDDEQVLAPTDLIRVAEEAGLITQLTSFALATALSHVAEWVQAGYDIEVAVNLSAYDLLVDRLPEQVRDLLTIHQVDGSRLTLELTESALVADTPRIVETIGRLNDLGIHIALDDFGTGYSTLSYLQQFSVDELKIDQRFVTSMLQERLDAVIVESTIDLGHRLNLRVVAEGVADQATARRIIELGGNICQGTAISRPLSRNDLLIWLAECEYSVPLVK